MVFNIHNFYIFRASGGSQENSQQPNNQVALIQNPPKFQTMIMSDHLQNYLNNFNNPHNMLSNNLQNPNVRQGIVSNFNENFSGYNNNQQYTDNKTNGDFLKKLFNKISENPLQAATVIIGTVFLFYLIILR